ncbi:FAD/NAD(P)-binding protein [Actinacidiphila bryophytorum]|uniref:FAD-NAD(P)-binding n=1 Tax=Actinacidiphila bryophytorum TaxID=1436133 RepID=A0A9W4H174_9ACTN|nr:FAD/NAD(P)-binding protein [Actinacidiphila bryophytorum]MBM9434934.1 FAD/NAD(P)-binding protein [Actinacidiphila bryophytorum]MBN6544867.1 FAD/NAD(P)-binding protein [Actinacidiphila bryophytorum]CAG7641490.1 FAD-NAD(P)-binding [Actinacidiphila bryophytorum]
MSGGRIEVCLVGAGPRGLSLLERICAQERRSARGRALTVHVVDPDPPGAGRVWRPTQSRHLLMNTVASQVTVFTDASVHIEGPLEEGPSLYQWAKALEHIAATSGATSMDDAALSEARALGPDTYPTRALYGQYLTWAFRHVAANAPAHVAVRVHKARAIGLVDGDADLGGAGPQTVLLDDGTLLTGLSAVMLAQGHVPVLPTGDEAELAGFAAGANLTYVPPANPADVDLSSVAPGEHVLIRGLGLNFFDYMALFTHGRGGVFERVDGQLVYRPSGREPRLFAGSRRGVPYQARGDNEKGAHGRYAPRLLTAEYVAALRTPSTAREPIRFGTGLWSLIAMEVQSVYYETLIARRETPTAAADFAARYLTSAPGEAERELLEEAGIEEAERWDWARVARPYDAGDLHDLAAFRAWLRGYLDEDVRKAHEGNVSGPFKAALDILRDLRNEVRLAVDHGGLDAASHRDELDGWYTPLNAYLSIGPPASRIEEMAALIDAGVLAVTGPGMQIDTDPGAPAFVCTSREIPDVLVRATVLIEGRLPDIDLRRTADPLMGQLLRTGQCRPYRVAGSDGTDYETGGLAVSERPYRLLDARGRAHPRRFAYGVPTESVHWVTAAGIRPGVGSVTLEDSDAIAAAVLALPVPQLPPVRLPEQVLTGYGTAAGAGA